MPRFDGLDSRWIKICAGEGQRSDNDCAADTVMEKKLIVSCSRHPGEPDAWFGPQVTDQNVRWASFDDRPANYWERKIKKPNLALARTALQAVLTARREQARLLFITDAGASFWCGLVSAVFRSQIPYCTFTFNLPELPSGIKRYLMSVALRRIGEIYVHSSMERTLYSSHFRIPVERFKVRLWGIGKPDVMPEHSLQPKPYISAIGGNGRDYRTLMEASTLVPHIPLVVVARPESLEGIAIPSHVRVLTSVPMAEAMNTLRYSEFMVLPLRSSTVPCGHVTLVCAMHLGKAVIATESEGISDYVTAGCNGLLCKASSPSELAAAITKLWNDPGLTKRLAASNEAFGAAHCTERIARADLAELMIRHNLLTDKSTPVLPTP